MSLFLIFVFVTSALLVISSIFLWNGRQISIKNDQYHVEVDPDETPVIEKSALKKHLSMIDRDN
jgi:hypothetical protein